MAVIPGGATAAAAGGAAANGSAPDANGDKTSVDVACWAGRRPKGAATPLVCASGDGPAVFTNGSGPREKSGACITDVPSSSGSSSSRVSVTSEISRRSIESIDSTSAAVESSRHASSEAAGHGAG